MSIREGNKKEVNEIRKQHFRSPAQESLDDDLSSCSSFSSSSLISPFFSSVAHVVLFVVLFHSLFKEKLASRLIGDVCKLEYEGVYI